jgi:hypothetical protein
MYEFHGRAYDRAASEEQIADQRARLFRTHPTPYSTGPSPDGKDYSSTIKRPPQNANTLGEYVPVYEYLNTTRDFLSTMGYNRPERISPPAHVDWRSVYIDNGSDTPLNIAIGTSPFEPPDKIQFRLQPEEGRWVLINSYGGSPQYLWPFYTSPESCGPRDSHGICLAAGRPRILANNANSFVLKQGVVGINIITFQYPTFSAS